MIKILSKAGNSEGYIINPKGKLIGKILLPNLILIKNKEYPPENSLYSDYLSLNEDKNILESIDLIKDFVGESVPVVDKDDNILGIITESDLFGELLTAEKFRNQEELSD